jgi:TonB family protein
MAHPDDPGLMTLIPAMPGTTARNRTGRSHRPLGHAIAWRLAIGLVTIGLLAPLAAKDEAGTYSIAEIMDEGTPPRPISRAAPFYPYNMRQAGVGGRVVIEFIIDTKGNVIRPKVIRSNNPWFERPALDAIMAWKFTPAKKNGVPVNVLATQLLEFQTDGGSSGGTWKIKDLTDKDRAGLPPEARWDTAPVPTSTTYPVYPRAALEAGQQGLTKLNFVVGADGRVQAAKILEATTPEMGHAALAMIETWEFSPPSRKDGKACVALLSIQHEFRSNGRGDVPVSEETKALLKILGKSPEKIVAADKLDQPITPISTRKAVYPTVLKPTAEAGEAVVDFFIDSKGDVQLASVVSCTAPEFGYAAVQAVATWRFEPPLREGKPVITRAQVPMHFAGPFGAKP